MSWVDCQLCCIGKLIFRRIFPDAFSRQLSGPPSVSSLSVRGAISIGCRLCIGQSFRSPPASTVHFLSDTSLYLLGHSRFGSPITSSSMPGRQGMRVPKPHTPSTSLANFSFLFLFALPSCYLKNSLSNGLLASSMKGRMQVRSFFFSCPPSI